MRKRFNVVAIVVIAMMLMVPAVMAGNSNVIFDGTVEPLPPSLVSQPFQAQQTVEFGDHIAFAGTSRVLSDVTISMVTWAPQSDYPEMTDPSGWTHPLTLNLYDVTVDPNGNPAVGALLETKTETFLIPWRPAADTACGTRWMADDNTCYNGYAFNITFDLSSLDLTLPNEIIYGIAFNTQSYGTPPMGSSGPYNSLNVGLNTTNPVPSVGTDVEPDAVFWNTLSAQWYADSGAGGVGTFRRDTGWTGYLPAVQFTAIDSDTVAPDVEINAPSDGDVVQGVIDIVGTVVDDNPHHYWLVVQNSSGTKVSGPATVDEDESLTNEVLDTWDTTVSADGVYTIKLEAKDAYNNKDGGSVHWISVTVNNIPDNKDQCKNGGWETFGSMSFANQGQCIKYVNTGK